MSQPLRVLIVEDSESDARLMLLELQRGGYAPQALRVETAAALTTALAAQEWDVILSDYRLPQFTGLEALQLVRDSGRNLPFILVSGALGEEQAVAVMKAGAHDFLLKDRLPRLAPVVSRELADARVRRQRKEAEAALLRINAELAAKNAELHEAHIAAVNLAQDADAARQQAELAAATLDESEKRFRALTEKTSDLISMVDRSGTLLYESPNQTRVLGYPPGALLGQNIFELIHPEDQARVLTLFRDGVHEPGAVLQAEARIRTQDGSWRWLDTIATNLLEDPAVRGIVFNSRDVTEHKRAEAALRESEERIQQALRVSHSFTFEWRPATDQVLRSESCATILGVTGAEICHDTGQSYFGRVHPDDRARFIRILGDLTPAATAYATEYRVTRGDGSVVVLDEAGQGTFDAAGKLVRLVGVATDITARKRAEYELRLRNTELIKKHSEVRAAHVALQTREQQMQQALRVSHSFTFEWEADTDRTLHSANCESILNGPGTATRYETGAQFIARVHPDDRARYVQIFADLTPAARFFTTEFRFVRNDGTVLVLEETAEATFDAAGKLHRLVGITTDITARKQVEAALRDREEQLRLFVEHAPAAIAMFDHQMRYLVASQRWLADYGFAGQDLRGRSHYEIFPEIPDRWREIHQRCLAGAVERADEDPFPRADGRLQWLQWEIRPWHTATGAVGGIIIFSEDITARKLALEETRLHSAALQAAANGIAITNRAGVLKWVNAAFTRLTGYTAAEAVGQNPRVLKSGQHPPKFYAKMWATITAGHIWHGELVNKRKDGMLYTEEMTITPVRNASGTITHFVAIKQDITERKQTEAALLQSEERFRVLAHGTHEGIAISEQGRFVVVNEQLARLLGSTRDELRGLEISAILAPQDRARVLANIRANRESHVETDLLCKDGSRRTVEAHGQSIIYQGRSMRVTAIHDVTERRQAEAALRQAHDELERRVQERTEQLETTNAMLQHALRGWQALSECNQVLLRATSESELLQQICRVIIEVGGYRMAWVGLAEADARQRVRPVAWAGEEQGYLQRANIVWSTTPRGRGPTGTAIRTGRPSVCRNLLSDPQLAPWRRTARQCGYNASVALPLLAAGRCYGALTIYATKPETFDDAEVQLLTELANNVTFGIQTQRSRAVRTQLEQEVLEISEREQRRIGQDLHDGLGQRLAAVRFQLAALSLQLAKNKPPSAAHVVRIEQELQQALEETRQIARGLHPVRPEADSLMSALHELADRVTQLFKIPCQFSGRQRVLIHDHTAATHLYRIVQEAVNNAVRHGRPQHIHIALTQTDGCVHLRIEDDGRGLPAAAKRAGGLGLGIMQYRASVLGATFAIGPRRGCGTVITCDWKPSVKEPHAKENRKTNS